ncbi:MAG TPA: hypothetical protein VGF59_34895 [Bryobacteraceae bacterium]|jgi:hypothetical protein
MNWPIFWAEPFVDVGSHDSGSVFQAFAEDRSAAASGLGGLGARHLRAEFVARTEISVGKIAYGSEAWPRTGPAVLAFEVAALGATQRRFLTLGRFTTLSGHNRPFY